jgi:hypothetical protein
MSVMTAEVKQRLRESAERKRKANPKAKDYEVEEWLILSDLAKESYPRVDVAADYFDKGEDGWPPEGRTLKYVSEEVIEALAAVVPTVRVRYSSGPWRSRTTRVFPCHFVVALLRVMRLDIGRYSTWWGRDAILRCQVK